MPLPPQVSGDAQLPHEATKRGFLQLSPPETRPHVFPKRAQNTASVSATHPGDGPASAIGTGGVPASGSGGRGTPSSPKTNGFTQAVGSADGFTPLGDCEQSMFRIAGRHVDWNALGSRSRVTAAQPPGTDCSSCARNTSRLGTDTPRRDAHSTALSANPSK
jgi:hypothetical protein